jgi:ribonucleotide monophosphatase NagD (HAD superfamily)
MIYSGLADVAAQFDTFIFDAYGVFWEGNGFYEGSREIMRRLLQQGKQVVIVSNSSALGSDLRVSYARRGLLEDNYSYLVSSGDLLQYHLQKGDITFAACTYPFKYFVIGKPHDKAFGGTRYQQVAKIEEADFVYIGVPYVYADTVAKYPQLAREFWPVRTDEKGDVVEWDTLSAEPFEEIVQTVADLGLPALNANPDFTAKEGHYLVPNSEAVFVVRNGMIAQMLRDKGVEVLEFGKPHCNIYDFVFDILHYDGVAVDKGRTCMIGDTVRTDIKGGINAGICPILCVETGITAEAISGGKTVESLCADENIDVKQIIQIKSVGGK